VNIPSTWVPRLKQTFTAANNGTVSTNSVTVENKFPFPVLGGKVRFVVPKGSSYAVTNGVVTQEFDGTNVHVVDVSFDVQTNSSTTIYIAAGTPVDLCPNDPNKLVPGLCGCGVPEGTCVIPVTSISINPTTAKLNLNVTKQLTASILPTTATNKNISWLSSDINVATVSTDGFVTAVGGGNATITATTQDGNKVASTNVIVNPSTTVYPAEDAELAGALVVSNQPGYNGTGFADFTNMSNDYIKWTVYAPNYADFNLSFRYALASGPRNLKLTVNGVDKIASIVFPVTGAWSNWSNYNTTQALEAGNNTIMLTATGTSGGNFDELVISDGATGVKNLQSNIDGKSFKIYPNPYKQGKLSVQLLGFENHNNIEFSISNLLGQTIYKQQLSSNLHNEIYLPIKLDQSVYFITVESANLKVVEKLFVR
jgi:hypothetical protein